MACTPSPCETAPLCTLHVGTSLTSWSMSRFSEDDCCGHEDSAVSKVQDSSAALLHAH